MMIEEVSDGLKRLLLENHYNAKTIRFYEREWRKIAAFLTAEYGDTEFDMERGLAYLEKAYGFQASYNDGTLSQQRVQLLRVVHMLEDYRLHQVLTRRYYASKNPIRLNGYYSGILEKYTLSMSASGLSACTAEHYTTSARAFMEYLTQKGMLSAGEISLDACIGYLKTLAGYSFKTVEQNVCGIRHLLRFLKDAGLVQDDIAAELHMPAVSKNAKIPSAWKPDELGKMIQAIDRGNPTGKRDYAMILLACVLGIQIGDIKDLRFGDFDWNEKKLSFVQNKTRKPISFPIPDAVGWAVIDYIKNGRPEYYDTDVVFIKHMPPFDPFPSSDHLGDRIAFYMNKAGIRRDRDRHSGFHSLRHSAGTMLLDMDTPLPVITSILGHADTDTTGIYLKTDLRKLAECVLPLEVAAYE